MGQESFWIPRVQLPDEVRVHEFSAYRTQGVITPIFHQGKLSSIEDHAHILIFKEIFLIATRSLPGYLQSEEKTS